jgi:hypothetical protein
LKFRIIVFPCEISCTHQYIFTFIYWKFNHLQPCAAGISWYLCESLNELETVWNCELQHLEGDKNGYRKFVQLFETESCRTEKKITHVNEVLFEFVAKKISSHMMKVKILYTILCFSFIYHLNLDVKKERHKKKNF